MKYRILYSILTICLLFSVCSCMDTNSFDEESSSINVSKSPLYNKEIKIYGYYEFISDTEKKETLFNADSISCTGYKSLGLNSEKLIDGIVLNYEIDSNFTVTNIILLVKNKDINDIEIILYKNGEKMYLLKIYCNMNQILAFSSSFTSINDASPLHIELNPLID